ncbi:biopolymer transporter ExbD [Pseudoalteromonas sp. MMG005]|uniref:biopolymer transporter ExbD n=1 Tax=Pseudoalteromonas sp. MMG005 TaxID=2822682 RepID=UPI001FFD92D7|nr:biopolymer transporter ExbD [Pseudoalteromonas sp. MMG005]
MHKTRSAYQQMNATVDMNPMLDIVFILLIFLLSLPALTATRYLILSEQKTVSVPLSPN